MIEIEDRLIIVGKINKGLFDANDFCREKGVELGEAMTVMIWALLFLAGNLTRDYLKATREDFLLTCRGVIKDIWPEEPDQKRLL
jgi:hypothetical protein